MPRAENDLGGGIFPASDPDMNTITDDTLRLSAAIISPRELFQSRLPADSRCEFSRDVQALPRKSYGRIKI